MHLAHQAKQTNSSTSDIRALIASAFQHANTAEGQQFDAMMTIMHEGGFTKKADNSQFCNNLEVRYYTARLKMQQHYDALRAVEQQHTEEQTQEKQREDAILRAQLLEVAYCQLNDEITAEIEAQQSAQASMHVAGMRGNVEDGLLATDKRPTNLDIITILTSNKIIEKAEAAQELRQEAQQIRINIAKETLSDSELVKRWYHYKLATNNRDKIGTIANRHVTASLDSDNISTIAPNHPIMPILNAYQAISVFARALVQLDNTTKMPQASQADITLRVGVVFGHMELAKQQLAVISDIIEQQCNNKRQHSLTGRNSGIGLQTVPYPFIEQLHSAMSEFNQLTKKFETNGRQFRSQERSNAVAIVQFEILL